jgi:L-ribulokinase
MGSRGPVVYTPDERDAATYDLLFAEYLQLHDWFGRGGNEVMQRLRALRRASLGQAAS